MEKQQSDIEPPFKDFYHTLQLQPEADSEMIDQAYWHLARLYNRASASAPWARVKLDELNEAYSVLRSSALRDAYDKLRDGVLGANAPPMGPEPVIGPAPLPVMDKQHPRSREEKQAEPRSRRPGLPRLPSMPRLGAGRTPPPPRVTRAVDPSAVEASTKAMLDRWRQGTRGKGTVKPPPDLVPPAETAPADDPAGGA